MCITTQSSHLLARNLLILHPMYYHCHFLTHKLLILHPVYYRTVKPPPHTLPLDLTPKYYHSVKPPPHTSLDLAPCILPLSQATSSHTTSQSCTHSITTQSSHFLIHNLSILPPTYYQSSHLLTHNLLVLHPKYYHSVKPPPHNHFPLKHKLQFSPLEWPWMCRQKGTTLTRSPCTETNQQTTRCTYLSWQRLRSSQTSCNTDLDASLPANQHKKTFVSCLSCFSNRII